MLNGRVRNGNGCGHPGMVAGKLRDGGRPFGRAVIVARRADSREAGGRIALYQHGGR